MARVGRLAGAILAETGDDFYLVGNTKQPCDWGAAGFERPPVDPSAAPFIKLASIGPVTLASPCLTMALEGEPLAQALAQRFLVARNGSVSERLWRLVLRKGVADDDEADTPQPPVVDANWLAEIPAPFWILIRDTVLRCL